MSKTATKPSQISNNPVGELLKRAGQLEDDMDAVKAEKKDLAKEIKDEGIKMKEFRAALKEMRKPLDPEFKRTVNLYLEQGGQYAMFAGV